MDPFERTDKVPDLVINFKQQWHNNAEEIKKIRLSRDSKNSIRLKYDQQKIWLEMSMAKWEKTCEVVNILHSVDSELQIALEIAHSNYQETEKPIMKSKVDAYSKTLETIKELIKKIKFPI
jgi:hypothetical protein